MTTSMTDHAHTTKQFCLQATAPPSGKKTPKVVGKLLSLLFSCQWAAHKLDYVINNNNTNNNENDNNK